MARIMQGDFGRRVITALLLASFCALQATQLWSQVVPEKQEEVVYYGEMFDSQGYAGQFFPQGEETIYVIADVPNILMPRRTLVYWWDISQEYKADWEGLDEALAGTLEVGSARFEMTQYSLKYDGGYESARTSLLIGDEATANYDEYITALRAYNAALATYAEEKQLFEEQLIAWGKQVDEARARGESLDDIAVPTQPQAPEQPMTVVTTPQNGFAVQLPVGEHQMVLRDESGAVVPGSERTVVAFSPRREGVAFKVMAANTYTVPDTSTEPNDTILVSGKNDLYLQPAYEKEYDNYYAAKALNSQDREAQDRRGVWAWLPSGAYEGDELAVSVNSTAAQPLERATFYVKQALGAALGYDILPYDSTVLGQVSTFDAFKITPNNDVIRISIPGVSGSEREIRVVNTSGGNWLLAMAMLPLAIGIGRLAYRQWKTH